MASRPQNPENPGAGQRLRNLSFHVHVSYDLSRAFRALVRTFRSRRAFNLRDSGL